MPSLRRLSQGIIALFVGALVVAAVAVILSSRAHAQAPAKPDVIEVLEITGEINQFTASSIANAVEKINETPKIKGVLLVVNSPGGGASASAVLYRELGKIKVPVVGYCEYMCASGGVYALMAPSVKFIAVSDETIGGSVGVYGQITRFNRLLDFLKIDNDVYKSGVVKGCGNPTQPNSDVCAAEMQKLVDDLAKKFYAVVLKSRPKADMAQIKTAAVFIGGDLVKVGLVDAVMTKEEAIKKLKDLSGSKNAYTREELRKVTRDATEAAGVSAPPAVWRGSAPAGSWESSLAAVVDIVREVRSGESVRIVYRAPYQF